jgi:hypothetical protein
MHAAAIARASAGESNDSQQACAAVLPVMSTVALIAPSSERHVPGEPGVRDVGVA